MNVSREDLARASPAGLAVYASKPGTWIYARHLQLIDHKLIQLERRRIKRLMVFMPPRHGKSELCSHHLPAWYLGKHQDHRVILTSHTQRFAASWGWKARSLLNQYGPDLFGVQVSQESSAKDEWDLIDLNGHRLKGGMVTRGVGGEVTGRGADLLVIDDPVKDAEEARSETIRENAWEWYRSTVHTRLEPDAVAILIMTRWHEDDLAGRLLREAEGGSGEQWEVLSLPALAEEENDALGRDLDEALWPDRWPAETLLQQRQMRGSYWWSAMYQQRPAPLEGGILRRSHFRYYTADSELRMFLLRQPDGRHKTVSWGMGRRLMTVDLATSEKTAADYTVIAIGWVTPDNDLLVEEIIRVRLEGPEVLQLVENAYHAWRPAAIDVESVGFQLALIQMLVRKGLPVRKLEAKGDKVGRALALGARMEAGTVYFKQGAPWLHELEHELVSFPNAEHDDQVDVLAYQAIDVTRYGSSQWDKAYGIKRCGACGHGFVGSQHQSCPRCGVLLAA